MAERGGLSELRCFGSCDAGEVVTAAADGDGAVGNDDVGVATVRDDRSQRRISRSEPP